MSRWFRRLFIAALAAGLVAMIGIGVWMYRVVLPDLPATAQIRDMHMQEALRVYADDGELIGEYGSRQRIPVPYARIPVRVRQAFLAAEDANFFHEPGVSWKGLLRAAVHLVLTGRKDQGGSTITMQVARNFFLTDRKTYARKVREIIVAIRIDQLLSKKQILDLYLNKIFLGEGAYGIQAAAHVYYGKDLTQLDLAQTAMIAGLPQAPSRINPIAGPNAALRRRAYVLGRMHDLGFINEQEYRKALAAPVTASLHALTPTVAAGYVGAMVRDAMVHRYGPAALSDGFQVYTTLDPRLQADANHALHWDLERYSRRHGYRGPEAKLPPGSLTHAAMDGALAAMDTVAGLVPGVVVKVDPRALRVYLGAGSEITVGWKGLAWARRYISADRMGPRPQSAADVAQPGDVVRVEKQPDGKWRLAQIPVVQGALVSLTPRNGAIRALVGGFSFQLSKFNRVTQALRQPGSSFKPFVYSAALTKGFTAATLINDAPVVLPGSSTGADWRPQDYEKTFRGPVLLQTGLADSLNLVAIRLLQDVGIDFARSYAARFGFDPQRIPDDLTLVLGSGSISPLESARAYSVFANGGFLVRPWLIQQVLDAKGKVVFQANPEVACSDCPVAKAAADIPASQDVLAAERDGGNGFDAFPGIGDPSTGARRAPRAISAQNDFVMVKMLQDVIHEGTGRAALRLGRDDLAGKTGTTNHQQDAWFAGFNPSLTTVSWVGFDRVQTLGHFETGARAALPMWMNFMGAALSGIPEQFIPRPPGLVTMRIDPKNGEPAGPDDPDAVFVTFRRRYAPSVPRGGGTPSPVSPPHLF